MKISIKLLALILICVVGISTGQLLFRKASTTFPPQPGWWDLATNGWLVTALVLYGVMTALWVWVLSMTPLYLAYPFMGLAFVLVPVMAWYFLGEPLHWKTLAGGAVIMLGIVLASME